MRTRMRMPVGPSTVATRSRVAQHQKADQGGNQDRPRMAASIVQCPWACPTRTITLVIEPGPASIGMPSGTMPASSLAAAASTSGPVSCVGDRLAFSMSRPISSKIIPPRDLKRRQRDPKHAKDILAGDCERRKHHKGGHAGFAGDSASALRVHIRRDRQKRRQRRERIDQEEDGTERKQRKPDIRRVFYTH